MVEPHSELSRPVFDFTERGVENRIVLAPSPKRGKTGRVREGVKE